MPQEWALPSSVTSIDNRRHDDHRCRTRFLLFHLPPQTTTPSPPRASQIHPNFPLQNTQTETNLRRPCHRKAPRKMESRQLEIKTSPPNPRLARQRTTGIRSENARILPSDRVRRRGSETRGAFRRGRSWRCFLASRR
ncbi:hypothetical protein LXL04_001423 [Taraxacum kok-saghyz]